MLSYSASVKNAVLSVRGSALIGAGVALICFLCLCGPAVLNPKSIDWLLQPNCKDSIQHFIGWEFFRYEPWHVPLGTIRNYGYPIPTSVVYTDSIPLFALIFKCFSHYLPKFFQYFGCWYALCFIAQGLFAWLLCTRLCDVLTSRSVLSQFLLKISMTLFFILSPIMLNRMFEHQALVAHWVILAGFYLYLRPYSRASDYYWLALNTVTLLIHAYLACMVFGLWGAFLYRQLIGTQQSSWCHGLKLVVLQGILFISFAWLSGYFMVPFSSLIASPKHSFASMNLLAPFIPTSGSVAASGPWSRFITVLSPVHFEQRTEGFNYFGLGMLLLVALGLLRLIKKIPDKKTLQPWMPLLFMCLLMAIYSLSNEVYLGQTRLFSYPLASSIGMFTTLFRASGRFFWPAYYLIMLLTFALLSRRIPAPLLMPLLVLGLCLQCTDLSEKLAELHRYFNSEQSIQATRMPFATMSLKGVRPTAVTFSRDKPMMIIPSDKIASVLAQGSPTTRRHLVFLPYQKNPAWQINHFGEYLHFAALENMTVNVGYFARENRVLRYQKNKLLERQVYQGLVAADTLYIVVEQQAAALIAARRTDLSIAKNRTS